MAIPDFLSEIPIKERSTRSGSRRNSFDFETENENLKLFGNFGTFHDLEFDFMDKMKSRSRRNFWDKLNPNSTLIVFASRNWLNDKNELKNELNNINDSDIRVPGNS